MCCWGRGRQVAWVAVPGASPFLLVSCVVSYDGRAIMYGGPDLYSSATDGGVGRPLLAPCDAVAGGCHPT